MLGLQKNSSLFFKLKTPSRVVFKQNERLVALPELGTFPDDMQLPIRISVHNDTINNFYGYLTCQFPYFGKYSEILNNHNCDL